MVDLIAPHGGTLVNRRALAPAEAELRDLPRVQLSARALSDVFLIANGAFSPLTGFMNRADYESVVQTMRLAGGLAWSLPVTLAVAQTEADALNIGARVLLSGENDQPVAILTLAEKYAYDKAEEARQVYGTEESAHPGVAALQGQGEVLLGGSIEVFADPPRPFDAFDRDPAETRRVFAEKGWNTVVAFQTRNPVHRAHEYIQKSALEIVDGLLLHPLVGETKSDDIPADLRMRCYEVLLDNYYPADRVLLSVFPAAMRYAGPREAIFHALVRKNYGCSHIIIGRDHAGVGGYYGTYDAQRLFSAFGPGELGITPLMFENSFFCKTCGNMASAKTCPHQASDHLSLSGTRVREMLAAGEYPPAEFTRREVADVLVAAYQQR